MHVGEEKKKMRAPGTKLGARMSLATRQHQKDWGIHGLAPPQLQITRLYRIPKGVKPQHRRFNSATIEATLSRLIPLIYTGSIALFCEHA
jgi:hypothetical protein